MMKKIQTKETWHDTINNENVVALFTADWCPDCRVIEPDLPEIEEAFSAYTFVSIDRDELLEIAQEYGIMGIPSFLVFHRGKEAGRFVSKDRKTKEEIFAFLNDLPKQEEIR